MWTEAFIITPQPSVISQIQNWINREIKNWEIAGVENKNRKKEDKNPRQTNIAWLNPNKSIDTLIWGAVNKANKRWRYQLNRLDGYQYAEYNQGDHYDWHRDIFDEIQTNGQRKISMTMFLNNDYEGGEFWYEEGSPLLKSRHRIVEPIVGSMVFFPSSTWHKVSPVTKGQRKSLVTWVWGNVW